MVVALEVELVMCLNEPAIRFEKRWVTRDSLVEQLSGLEQFRFRGTAKTC